MVMEYKGEGSVLELAMLEWGVSGKGYNWGELLGWCVTPTTNQVCLSLNSHYSPLPVTANNTTQ
jgi:hypothetical protein